MINDEDEDDDFWQLNDADLKRLRRLRAEVRGLVRLARTGNDLIAIGEVWEALDDIRENREVCVLVELTVGFRRGDRDFSEGCFLGLRVGPDGIVLDELNTTFASGAGSDHSTAVHDTLTPDSGFNEVDFEGWLGKLDQICNFDDVQLTVSREHV